MEAAESDHLDAVLGAIGHFEEFVAKRIVAGAANGPRFGLAQVDQDKVEFSRAFDDGGTKIVRVGGPRHDVNIGSTRTFQKIAFGERPYFRESDPELPVHGVIGERGNDTRE